MNIKHSLPELSVFFHCYNEEENIGPLLEQALSVFPQYTDKLEILIIDDGSTDRTRAIAEEIAAKNSVVRVISQKNGGYGAALRTGLEQARYGHVFFADADLQFDLKEFKKLLPGADADMVIGYRLTRADGFKRVITMKMLKVWSMIFLGYPWYIKDTNCAFKMMKRTSLRRLLPLVTDGAMISTELLLRAHRAGMRIAQVGVHHFDRIHGEATGQKPGVIATAVKETFILRNSLKEVRPQTQETAELEKAKLRANTR